MMARKDEIIKLTKQLYPTGRAFRISENSDIRKFLYGLGISEATAFDDALSILNQILPDNVNFTEEDATLWENRLNLKVNPPGLTLAERMLLIARKYAFPGEFIYRQNWRFIEYQLQLAGFDVYVHENRFPDGGGGWEYINVFDEEGIQHWTDTEHGYDSEMGFINIDIVANSKEPNENYDPGVGTNYKGAFFIGGASFPDRTFIIPDLEIEFRKLICQLKPANTFAILLIDFVHTGELDFMSGDPFLLMSGDPLELKAGS
jgi:hypothetical protein